MPMPTSPIASTNTADPLTEQVTTTDLTGPTTMATPTAVHQGTESISATNTTTGSAESVTEIQLGGLKILRIRRGQQLIYKLPSNLSIASLSAQQRAALLNAIRNAQDGMIRDDGLSEARVSTVNATQDITIADIDHTTLMPTVSTDLHTMTNMVNHTSTELQRSIDLQRRKMAAIQTTTPRKQVRSSAPEPRRLATPARLPAPIAPKPSHNNSNGNSSSQHNMNTTTTSANGNELMSSKRVLAPNPHSSVALASTLGRSSSTSHVHTALSPTSLTFTGDSSISEAANSHLNTPPANTRAAVSQSRSTSRLVVIAPRPSTIANYGGHNADHSGHTTCSSPTREMPATTWPLRTATTPVVDNPGTRPDLEVGSAATTAHLTGNTTTHLSAKTPRPIAKQTTVNPLRRRPDAEEIARQRRVKRAFARALHADQRACCPVPLHPPNHAISATVGSTTRKSTDLDEAHDQTKASKSSSGNVKTETGQDTSETAGSTEETSPAPIYDPTESPEALEWRRPFSDWHDVVNRLLPWHVYQYVDEDLEIGSRPTSDAFGNIDDDLVMALHDRYERLCARMAQIIKPYADEIQQCSVAEMVAERLVLEEEQRVNQALKRRVTLNHTTIDAGSETSLTNMDKFIKKRRLSVNARQETKRQDTGDTDCAAVTSRSTSECGIDEEDEPGEYDDDDDDDDND